MRENHSSKSCNVWVGCVIDLHAVLLGKDKLLKAQHRQTEQCPLLTTTTKRVDKFEQLWLRAKNWIQTQNLGSNWSIPSWPNHHNSESVIIIFMLWLGWDVITFVAIEHVVDATQYMGLGCNLRWGWARLSFIPTGTRLVDYWWCSLPAKPSATCYTLSLHFSQTVLRFSPFATPHHLQPFNKHCHLWHPKLLARSKTRSLLAGVTPV